MPAHAPYLHRHHSGGQPACQHPMGQVLLDKTLFFPQPSTPPLQHGRGLRAFRTGPAPRTPMTTTYSPYLPITCDTTFPATSPPAHWPCTACACVVPGPYLPANLYTFPCHPPPPHAAVCCLLHTLPCLPAPPHTHSTILPSTLQVWWLLFTTLTCHSIVVRWT